MAKSSVVVLNFGGRGGSVARRVVTGVIHKKYAVIPGKRLLAACDELGVRFGKGKNLAKAAEHVGAVAVIGGKVTRRRLNLAVFSGVHGRPIVSTTFKWGRRPPKASVRRLRKVLLRALVKEARRVRKKRRGKKKTMTFAPDPVSKSTTDNERPDDSLKFDPSSTDKSSSAAPESGASKDDDPPDLKFTPDGATGDVDVGVPDGEVKRGVDPGGDRPPRVIGLVGVGIWSRSFTLNQAEGQHNEYSSGAAFALQLALRAWPLAFLTDGFLSNIYLRSQFQIALGLSTRPPSGASDGSFSTSMWELVFDGGYSWKILDSPTSPIIDIGMGGGTVNFAVNWGEAAAEISDVGYPFMLFGIGGRYPIVRALSDSPGALLRDLGIEVRFDYRIVFGAGQVAEDEWYGSASQGGLAVSAGFNWRYKQIVACLAYTYTRYFLDFDDDKHAERVAASKLAAGGALDQFHGFLVTGGYSF